MCWSYIKNKFKLYKKDNLNHNMIEQEDFRYKLMKDDYNNFQSDKLHNNFQSDKLHNNFQSDKIYNNFQSDNDDILNVKNYKKYKNKVNHNHKINNNISNNNNYEWNNFKIDYI